LRQSIAAALGALTLFALVKWWGVVVIDGVKAPALVTDLMLGEAPSLLQIAYSVLYTITLVLAVFSVVNPRLLSTTGSFIKVIGLWLPLALALNKYLPYLVLIGAEAPSYIALNVPTILALSFLHLFYKSATVGRSEAPTQPVRLGEEQRPIPSEEEL